MLLFADGVRFNANKYTNTIIGAAQRAYAKHGIFLVTVTSGNDKVHGPNSYHAKDRALDLRFWNIHELDRPAVAQTMRSLLPPYYDVVIEDDHFHVEADENKEAKWSSSTPS